MMFVPKLGTEQLGVSLEAGSSLLAILGVTNFIARFLVGFISQKNVASPVTLQFLGRLGCSLCAMSYHFINTYWLMATVVGVQGIAKAFYICADPLAALKLFGVARVNFVMGMVLFSASIGTFGSSPVVSHFYETSEDKLFGGLSVISSTYGIAAALSLIMLAVYKHNNKPSENHQPSS